MISQYPPSSKEKLIEIIQRTYHVVHDSSYDTDDRTEISNCNISGAHLVNGFRHLIALLEQTLELVNT
jgi:hypothetical protein